MGKLDGKVALVTGSGRNIGECLAFGRVSGRNAAAETPWE